MKNKINIKQNKHTDKIKIQMKIGIKIEIKSTNENEIKIIK